MEKGEINQLGYLMTIGAFRSQRGVRQTFSQELCDAIGGYPKGVILRYEQAQRKKLPGEDELWRPSYDVVSVQDNNTKNFNKTAFNPNPYEIGSKVDGKIWWKFLEERELNRNMSLLPDLLTAEIMTFDDAKSFPDSRFMTICSSSEVTHIYGINGDGQHGDEDTNERKDNPGAGFAPMMQCNTYIAGKDVKVIVSNVKGYEI